MNIPTPDQAARAGIPELSGLEELILNELEIPQYIQRSGGSSISWTPTLLIVDPEGNKRKGVHLVTPNSLSVAQAALKIRGWILTQEISSTGYYLKLVPDPKRKVDLEDDLLPPPQLTLGMKIRLFIVKLLRKLV